MVVLATAATHRAAAPFPSFLPLVSLTRPVGLLLPMVISSRGGIRLELGIERARLLADAIFALDKIITIETNVF